MLEHSQKNSKKIQKIHFGFISSQIGLGQADKEKKKNSFRLVPNRPALAHYHKNCKKTQKIKKLHSGIISSQTEYGQVKIEIGKNSFQYFPTRPGLEHSQINSKP